MIIKDGKTLADRFAGVTEDIAEMLCDVENAHRELFDFITEEYNQLNTMERDQLNTALHRLSSIRGLKKTLLSGFLEFRVYLKKKEGKAVTLEKGRSKHE